jgi:hypothetical protein
MRALYSPIDTKGGVILMANMTWTPDEHQDKKAKQYLDKINHAPYVSILLGSMLIFLLFTTLILFGTF